MQIVYLEYHSFAPGHDLDHKNVLLGILDKEILHDCIGSGNYMAIAKPFLRIANFVDC